ncbi:Piriformospora indica-insensitive protein 2 [Acorus gramineus]|uniref:Piriformospora indica-insensitive protein 2 n=1 Tax=Acorus gramineus TaxID=55184 RepID=A0AAV9BT82_ACOGR|nr:Piriformospora indica-insensitive protein 2 [Acorus gramineus]
MGRCMCFEALLLLLLLCLLSRSGVSAEEDASTAPMENSEIAALYSVMQSFVGKWWKGSELYPDPCGWTPIQGVSCDIFNGLWYVTVLNIGPILENSIECTPEADFPPQLFELKHLKSLSLFNCFTSPTHHPTKIPTQNWEKLAGSLETLEFRSNPGLTGEIPFSLGRLVKLQSLVLVENALMGEIPTSIGSLTSLKKLALTSNLFSGQIPSSLGNLTDLLIFDLSMNSLSGTVPFTLSGLRSLLKLDLSNNALEGKLPMELGLLKNLTLLDLRSNNFSGGLVQSLQYMDSIQDVLLSNNSLEGSLMGFGWESLQNLTTLDLSNTGLNGQIPESIGGLKRLRFLALGNNRLSGSVPASLANLPSISALYLNGNNLTGELLFSDAFYEKMGRRFAAWSNPNLCYGVGLARTGHKPSGVRQCEQHEVSITSSNLKTVVVGDDRSPEASFMASPGFSASFVGEFWFVFFAKELVVILLLVLLL